MTLLSTKNVQTKVHVYPDILILNLNGDLMTYFKALRLKFITQGGFINAFQQSWSQCRMYFVGASQQLMRIIFVKNNFHIS